MLELLVNQRITCLQHCGSLAVRWA